MMMVKSSYLLTQYLRIFIAYFVHSYLGAAVIAGAESPQFIFEVEVVFAIRNGDGHFASKAGKFVCS